MVFSVSSVVWVFLCCNLVAICFSLNLLAAPVKWLVVKIASEMTCNVSNGTLNPHRYQITLAGCWTQVWSRTTDTEPHGWWPARIHMMKGEFAVVDYVGYESTYSDILALDNIRHRNTKYTLCLHHLSLCIVLLVQLTEPVWLLCCLFVCVHVFKQFCKRMPV